MYFLSACFWIYLDRMKNIQITYKSAFRVYGMCLRYLGIIRVSCRHINFLTLPLTKGNIVGGSNSVANSTSEFSKIYSMLQLRLNYLGQTFFVELFRSFPIPLVKTWKSGPNHVSMSVELNKRKYFWNNDKLRFTLCLNFLEHKTILGMLHTDNNDKILKLSESS